LCVPIRPGSLFFPYTTLFRSAGMIVFFGVAGTLLFYFLRSLGPFIVPFMVVGDIEPFRLPGYVRVFFSVCFFLYFCVLMLFFFRSEEHTSELQSRENLVCRLL